MIPREQEQHFCRRREVHATHRGDQAELMIARWLLIIVTAQD